MFDAEFTASASAKHETDFLWVALVALVFARNFRAGSSPDAIPGGPGKRSL
jgi:hypothetical protein